MLSRTVEDLKHSTRIAELVPGLKRSGAYFIGPCPFCGGTDRFNVKTTEGGDLWICRQCGDGRYHDAIDFLQRSTGKTFSELVATGSPAGAPIVQSSAPNSAPVDLLRPPDEDWQTAALAAAGECADRLWADTVTGRAAMRYLQDDRKLTAATIRGATLGFNDQWREVLPGKWLAPGVTIPCMVDGDLWYLQVRTTKEARDRAAAEGRSLDKYWALKGSRTGALYGAGGAIGAVTLFATEGEFDSLVLGQSLPPGAAAVTMGGAGSLPSVTWLPFFAVADDIVLLLDNDERGRQALQAWRKLLPRARAGQLPDGSKDVTDFRRKGGNVAAWVADTLQESPQLRRTPQRI